MAERAKEGSLPCASFEPPQRRVVRELELVELQSDGMAAVDVVALDVRPGDAQAPEIGNVGRGGLGSSVIGASPLRRRSNRSSFAMGRGPMSQRLRIILFISGMWILGWSVMYFGVDGRMNEAKQQGFIMFALAPALALALIGWVLEGSKKKD